MNILVIGNGFDLAHGLPTKYGDFLEWVKVTRQVSIIENGATLKDVDWGKTDIQVKEFIINNKMNGNMGIFSQEKICNELLDDNFWIDYFLQCDMYQKENWIDFESEISRVIRTVDDDMKVGKFKEDSVVINCTEPYLAEYFLNDYELIEQAKGLKTLAEIQNIEKNEGKRWSVSQISEYKSQYENQHQIEDLKPEITYKQMIQKLEDNLNKLIRAFEIYLCEFVEKIHIVKKSPDIDGLDIDFILSFNYTHIFSTIYELSERSKKEIEDPFDYIHGEAIINNAIETDSMVLGIDEYLPKKKRNKKIEFIAFKKYYQRIHRGTGCKYKDWLEVIKKGQKEVQDRLGTEQSVRIPFNSYRDKRHYLYFYGHSLDVTDKDILRELILNDNVYTTIYYYKAYDDSGKDDNGRKDLGAKIANLVKVIGQDELIRRTGGSTKTIEFRLQQDMMERDKSTLGEDIYVGD